MRAVKIIAAIVFAGVLLVGACFGTVAYFGTKLDTSSKAYVDEVVPLVVKSWDVNVLLAKASEEMLNAMWRHNFASCRPSPMAESVTQAVTPAATHRT